MVSVNLRIGGMSCGHCVQTVRGLLEALEGVRDVEVEVGTARFSLPSSPSPEALGSVLDEAGFELQGYEEDLA